MAREWNLDLVWATAGLVGAVLVGVIAIVWLDRWRKRTRADMQAPADEIGEYRDLFDQGLLSADEYDRIRRRLEQRTAIEPDERIKVGSSGPRSEVKADALQPPPPAMGTSDLPPWPPDEPPADTRSS
jgi:hypothetical protein